MALPVSFIVGLLYSYLRENRKLLKQLTLYFGILLVAIMIYFFIGDDVRLNKLKNQDVNFIEGPYDSIEQMAALPQFSDKMVYVDLWFSSCKPCLEQFKNYLPKLKNELADRTDIEYLYIARETSHLDSKQRWLKVIDDYKLSGWHYYFPKTDESKIWTAIRAKSHAPVEGYPHYLLIYNGKIIDYQAPEPAELGKLLAVINDGSL